MSDPLGLIGGTGGVQGGGFPAPRPNGPAQDGPSFKQTLLDQLNQVNELQKNAEEAIDDLATGQRDDLEGVMLATLKADTAFRMLLQVRNKVMDAYEEVKQIRV